MKKSVYYLFGLFSVFAVVLGSFAFALKNSGPIDITSDIASYNIDNVLLNQQPDPVSPGSSVELRIKLQNLGDNTMEDVTVELIQEYPLSLVPGDNGTRAMGTLYAKQRGNEGAILYYRLNVDKDAPEDTYPLRLRYKTKQYDWVTMEPFGVRVQSSEGLLSVVSVESEPAIVEPGRDARLRITFRNMADSIIEDVKIKLDLLATITSGATISTTEQPFTPTNSTNEQILQSIGAGDEAHISFDLTADPDASANVYKIPLIATYRNQIGSNFTLNSVFGMSIGSEPELSLAIDSHDILPGKAGTVVVKFVNKDTADIKFLQATLQKGNDYEILGSSAAYVGNIDSDDYETAEFRLFVLKGKGTVSLPVSITYKDAHGRDYRRNEVLELRIYSSSEQKKFGLKKSSPALGILIAVAIIAAGLFAYRKWKKK